MQLDFPAILGINSIVILYRFYTSNSLFLSICFVYRLFNPDRFPLWNWSQGLDIRLVGNINRLTPTYSQILLDGMADRRSISIVFPYGRPNIIAYDYHLQSTTDLEGSKGKSKIFLYNRKPRFLVILIYPPIAVLERLFMNPIRGYRSCPENHTCSRWYFHEL